MQLDPNQVPGAPPRQRLPVGAGPRLAGGGRGWLFGAALVCGFGSLAGAPRAQAAPPLAEAIEAARERDLERIRRRMGGGTGRLAVGLPDSVPRAAPGPVLDPTTGRVSPPALVTGSGSGASALAASARQAGRPLPPVTPEGIPGIETAVPRPAPRPAADLAAEAELQDALFAGGQARGKLLAQAGGSGGTGDGRLTPEEEAAARARARAARDRAAAARDAARAAATGGERGGTAAKPAATGLPPTDEELVNVDFKEVDVKTILRFLAEKSRTNYFMDPAIASKITVIGPNPIPISEAVVFLEAILEARGFTVIDSGSFKQVVPKAAMLKEDVPLHLSPPDLPDAKLAQDRTVTEVLEIQHSPVEEVKTAIASLLSNGSAVIAHPGTNKLVLTETMRNLERIRRVIAEIDVPVRGKVVELIPVRFRKAEDLVKSVGEILKGEEAEKLVPPTKQETVTRPVLLADPLQNLVIAVATSRDLAKVRDLVAQLDADPASGPAVQFLTLEHADPQVVVDKVKAAFESPGATGGPGFALVPDERTRSLLLRSGSPNLAAAVVALVRKLDRDVAGAEGSRVRVYRMEFAEAEKVAEILGKIDFVAQARPGGAGGAGKAAGATGGGERSEEVKIVADANTNSLVITAPRDLFQAIEAVVRELDVVKPQVLVEVLIAEVDYDWARGRGIDFSFLNESSSSVNRPFAVGNNDIVESFLSQAGVANGLNVGLIHGRTFDAAAAAGGDFGELSKIATLARFFETSSHANILSAPVLMTSDNEPAKITVGEKIQLPASFVSGANAGLNTITSFNTEELGVILDVTPRITKNDHVVLKVTQKISARTGDVLGALQTPVISNRQVESNIHVKNGETTVIGGLISEDEQRTHSKMPLLGDLPGIGKLFRNRTTQKRKTNLLIFLTPHVIRGEREARAITARARNDLSREIDRSQSSNESEIRKVFREGRTLGHYAASDGSGGTTMTGSGEPVGSGAGTGNGSGVGPGASRGSGSGVDSGTGLGVGSGVGSGSGPGGAGDGLRPRTSELLARLRAKHREEEAADRDRPDRRLALEAPTRGSGNGNRGVQRDEVVDGTGDGSLEEDGTLPGEG